MVQTPQEDSKDSPRVIITATEHACEFAFNDTHIVLDHKQISLVSTALSILYQAGWGSEGRLVTDMSFVLDYTKIQAIKDKFKGE